MRAVVLLSALCGSLTALALAVGGTAAPGPCQAGDTPVSIAGFQFSPASITVTPNTTVCWTNQDAVTHTVTSNSAGLFDSGSLAKSQSFRHTFTSEGTFGYDCDVYGHDMPGTVTVTAASTPPPGPPPPGPPPPGPPPPAPPPPPSVPPPPQRLQVSGVRIAIAGRMVVARARLNRGAVSRLSIKHGSRRRSARKQWRPGANTIRLAAPAKARGRWTAELQVGGLRFRRSIWFG